ncbi:MAG: hypothetical protein IH996_02635 [Proteobacteria bacterium]|nr:hypothetical protein [Pseudomonadota bacterium]
MPELSRDMSIENLTVELTEFQFEASEDECRALADRLGILVLHNFKVAGGVRRVTAGGDIHLSGHIQAALDQNCSITLEPIWERVNTSFNIRFSDRISEDTPIGQFEEQLGDRSLEPMPAGPVDVGEIAVQYLSMAINPFPRTSGATLDAPAIEGVAMLSEEDDRKARSPFSALKKITDGV